MVLDLKYGRSRVPLDLDRLRNTQVLTGREAEPLSDLRGEVLSRLRRPTGTRSLLDEVRRKHARKVVIIVNDITRPTPYADILPPILDELREAGIADTDVTFVVATGIHRGMTNEELRLMLGDEVYDTYDVRNHDCDDDANLVDLGRLRFGTELYVNRAVLQADFVIATGVVSPHYFAGFSGGRKAILPGVSGRGTISHNHSLMTSEAAAVCNLDGNPVHIEMVEAARMAGVDFIVNTVTDGVGKIAAVVAGDVEKAWLEGVRICSHFVVAPIDRQVDVAIASAGGFPKDINIYQAQKAIDNAERAVKKGGTIVLLAECPEGCGEPTFESWMTGARSLDDIFRRFAAGFELGGHKAYSLARVLRDKEVILVSALDEAYVRNLFLTPAPDLNNALHLVESRHGKTYESTVMPSAGVVVPVPGGGAVEDI
ncbi:MAG: nickel-dependent lactate racemase [Firmicutes bacterium]|nr:nickel-dependent lactate racemase [Bacillota bacterium]